MERGRDGLRYLLKFLLALKRLLDLDSEVQALCKELRERRKELPDTEHTVPKIGRSLSAGETGQQTSERSAALLPEEFSSKELESFLPLSSHLAFAVFAVCLFSSPVFVM